MRLIQKILAGVLFTIGVPIILIGVTELLNPNASPEDKKGATAALVIFGLPPTALGGFVIWNLRRSHTTTLQELELQKEQLFLQILQENQGRVTPLSLAAALDMPIADAKVYLETKAQQLDATFDVTEEGGVNYRFHL